MYDQVEFQNVLRWLHPRPPKWEGRTGGAGDGGERGGSGMKGNRRLFIVNFTSTLLPDTDQHVQILKLHCMF